MYYAHLQLRNHITGHTLKPSNCRSTRRPRFWRPVPWIVNKITQQSEIIIRKDCGAEVPSKSAGLEKNHVTSLFFCFVIFFFFFYTMNATNHLFARQKMLWKLSQLTSVDWIDRVLNQVNVGLNIAVLTGFKSGFREVCERRWAGRKPREWPRILGRSVFPPSSKHINTMRWESTCKDRIGFWCEKVLNISNAGLRIMNTFKGRKR